MTDTDPHTADLRPVTWKQIRAFARLLKSLSLDSRPGVDDCLQATAEPSHKGRATKVIGTWEKAPINHEGIRDAIARWFAVGEALEAIGVGAGDTGIKPGLDYWSRMKNRNEFSKAHGSVAGSALVAKPASRPVPIPGVVMRKASSPTFAHRKASLKVGSGVAISNVWSRNCR